LKKPKTHSVKCHLSRIMGEKRLKISDVEESTGLNRGTISRLFHEEAQRVDLDALEKLCRFLDCQVGDLLELVDDKSKNEPEKDKAAD